MFSNCRFWSSPRVFQVQNCLHPFPPWFQHLPATRAFLSVLIPVPVKKFAKTNHLIWVIYTISLTWMKAIKGDDFPIKAMIAMLTNSHFFMTRRVSASCGWISPGNGASTLWLSEKRNKMEQIFFLFQVRLPKGNPNFKWLKPRLRVTSRYSNPKVDRKVKLEILPNSASFWGVGDGLTSPVAPCARTSWVPSGAVWRSSAWLPSNRGRWCQRNRRRTPRWKTNIQGSSGFLAICLWYCLNLFDMFQSLKHTRKAIIGIIFFIFSHFEGSSRDTNTQIAHCIVFRYLQMLQGKTCVRKLRKHPETHGFFPWKIEGVQLGSSVVTETSAERHQSASWHSSIPPTCPALGRPNDERRHGRNSQSHSVH